LELGDDKAEAEGLDDAASFREKLGCAEAEGYGVVKVKAAKFEDATSFGQKLGCSDGLIDCIAESESEGIDDLPLLDGCRVERLDGAGLIWIGAVAGIDGGEVGTGVKTLTGVEGLFAGDDETLGDNEMVGDTVVEIEGIDGFFVEVLTGLEVDGSRGDEDGKAIAEGLDDVNPSFEEERAPLGSVPVILSDGRENATPRPTADSATASAIDTQIKMINNLIRRSFHHGSSGSRGVASYTVS
jgi:hypothetical protein